MNYKSFKDIEEDEKKIQSRYYIDNPFFSSSSTTTNTSTDRSGTRITQTSSNSGSSIMSTIGTIISVIFLLITFGFLGYHGYKWYKDGKKKLEDKIDQANTTPLVPVQAPLVPVQAPLVPVQAPLVPVQAPLVPVQAPLVPVQARLPLLTKMSPDMVRGIYDSNTKAFTPTPGINKSTPKPTPDSYIGAMNSKGEFFDSLFISDFKIKKK